MHLLPAGCPITLVDDRPHWYIYKGSMTETLSSWHAQYIGGVLLPVERMQIRLPRHLTAIHYPLMCSASCLSGPQKFRRNKPTNSHCGSARQNNFERHFLNEGFFF